MSRSRKFLLVVVAVAILVAIGELLGVSIIAWVTETVEKVRKIPPRYIALVCLLKVLESVLTSIGWRNVLQAAFPEERISLRFVLGAYQGGVGLNSITPANAGSLLMLGLFRLRIPGASTAAILSAAVVQGLAFTVFAIVSAGVLLLTMPQAVDIVVNAARGTISFLRANADVSWVAAAVTGVILIVGFFWVRRRLTEFREQAARGGAILRTPRRYLTHVALPQAASYACRWGITMTFMAGLDIPVTLHSTFLVIGSNTLVNLVQITPGGLGTTEAVLVIALREYADASTVTAFSLAKTAVLAVWNVLFAAIALVLAFGFSGARHIFRSRNEIATEVQEKPAG